MLGFYLTRTPHQVRHCFHGTSVIPYVAITIILQYQHSYFMFEFYAHKHKHIQKDTKYTETHAHTNRHPQAHIGTHKQTKHRYTHVHTQVQRAQLWHERIVSRCDSLRAKKYDQVTSTSTSTSTKSWNTLTHLATWQENIITYRVFTHIDLYMHLFLYK